MYGVWDGEVVEAGPEGPQRQAEGSAEQVWRVRRGRSGGSAAETEGTAEQVRRVRRGRFGGTAEQVRGGPQSKSGGPQLRQKGAS